MSGYEIIEAKDGGIVVCGKDFARHPGLGTDILFAGNAKEALVYLEKALTKGAPVSAPSDILVISKSQTPSIRRPENGERLVIVHNNVDFLLREISPAEFSTLPSGPYAARGMPTFWSYFLGSIHVYPAPDRPYSYAIRKSLGL